MNNKFINNALKEQYLANLRRGSTHYTGIGLREAISRMRRNNPDVRPHMAGSIRK